MSQIDELRQIIVGDDADTLRDLKERIENIEKRTKDVAEVLPGAINERIRKDSKLSEALTKPVFKGLKEAIRKEPEAYGEILYPVMAPSIRRAISQAISSMLVTINQTIHSATTIQGFKYRFESMRTGVPYAQLMLRKTAPFVVEHVYLIDRDTGLLIKEVHAEGVESLDGDAVSAMFSAIQSFMRDSFSNDKSSRLTDFKSEHQSENQNIWIVHGSDMMLACVISGNAPESVRELLYDTLDSIHTDYANERADFDGDTTVFEGVESYLNPLVELDETVEKIKKTSVTRFILPILVVCGLVALGVHLYERYSALSIVKFNIQKTPGIAMTDAYWDDGKIIIEGLKDPDAVIPYYEFSRHRIIDPDTIVLNTIPFRSLESSMELQRFSREFVLPEGVSFSEVNGKIRLSGEGSIDWLRSNDLRIRQLAADGRLDISGLFASLNSISNLLSKEFSEAELSGVSSTIIADHNNQDLVQLFGRMPASSLNKLKSIFSNSYWVEVAVLAY